MRIGNYTLFGPGVQSLTPVHPMNAELRRHAYGKPIDIGADVWSVARRSFSPASASDPAPSVGDPCRVIREITE